MAGGARDQPAQARTLAAGPRAQEPAARRAPPLHRDGARAHRDGRRVDRRRRRHRDDQRRGAAAARRRSRGRRHARRRLFDARGSAAARHAAAAGARRRAATPPAQEITLARDGRELHLAAAATPLQGEDGSLEGAVLVFDDVTPLIRTQRVAAWRDVARRLAHEIKNPLTPIQLCAERMRRHFGIGAAAGPRARRRVHVDDRRRSRIAEGAGRRVRAVRADAGAEGRSDRSASTAARGARALQRPVPDHPDRAAVRRDAAAGPARRRADAPRRHQPRRQRRRGARRQRARAARPDGATPTIVVETQHDRAQRRRAHRRRRQRPRHLARPTATSCSCRTTRPSSAAAVSGLAIVRRIIVEHGGSIEVHDNEPHGHAVRDRVAAVSVRAADGLVAGARDRGDRSSRGSAQPDVATCDESRQS